MSLTGMKNQFRHEPAAKTQRWPLSLTHGAFVITPPHVHLSKANTHVIQLKTEEKNRGCLHQRLPKPDWLNENNGINGIIFLLYVQSTQFIHSMQIVHAFLALLWVLRKG